MKGPMNRKLSSRGRWFPYLLVAFTCLVVPATTSASPDSESQVYLRIYTSAEWQRQQRTILLDPASKMTLAECQSRRKVMSATTTLESQSIVPDLYIDCIDASYLEGPEPHEP